MSADEKTSNDREKKVITLLVTSHETGTENNQRYTRIVGPYGGRSLPVKVRGNMAAALNARLSATLSEGETIESKKLFVELTGEFVTFTNAQNQRRRYFSAEKFEVVQGPALELARMRREAASVIENAEMLRKAGRIDQAYRMVATTFAEFGQVPLDIADLDDDHLIGELAEPPVNAEKAALAQLAMEDAAAAAPAIAVDDEVVMEATSSASNPQDVAETLEFQTSEALKSDEINEEPAAEAGDYPAASEDDVNDPLMGADVDESQGGSYDREFAQDEADTGEIAMDDDDHRDEDPAEEQEASTQTPSPATSAPSAVVVRRRFG